MLIRQLTSRDAAACRDLPLEGLKNHPEAFSESAEEFAARSVGDLSYGQEHMILSLRT